MTDEVTAYHEAAHAVVAESMGAEFQITITPFEENGRTILGRVTTTLHGRASDYLEIRYLISYAGVVANRRMSGNTEGCGDDMSAMNKLLTEIAERDGLDQDEQKYTRRALEDATEDKVASLWPQIGEFANRLLEEKTITGKLEKTNAGTI